MKFKNVFIIFIFLLKGITAQSQFFARGADIGWLSEMEASGKMFYNSQGVEQDVLEILQSYCINSIRLRVWVNPQNGWCEKNDVVQMAKRATNMGFRLMIDFHYSDSWADPGQQNKPNAWLNYNNEQLIQAIYNHTHEVLSALKEENVYPSWVQIGNETNNGMLWENGRATDNMDTYAQFVTSGHNATKAIFPNALTIVHIANGNDNQLFRWNIGGLVNNNAQFDVIGMSLYPDPSSWQNYTNDCLSNMTDMISTYNKPIIISEIGMSYTSPNEAKAFVEDIIAKNHSLPNNMGLGVFWWEPQCYNWQYYDKGAWGLDGRPTIAMEGFRTNCEITPIDCNNVENGTAYFDNCGICVGGNTGKIECQAVSVTFKLATSENFTNAYITGTITSDESNWRIIEMISEQNNIFSFTTIMWPNSEGAFYFLNQNNWTNRETVPQECATWYNSDRGYSIGFNDTIIYTTWGDCNNYFDCNNTFNGNYIIDECDSCVSTIDACINQVLNLHTGWNLFSLYVNPSNRNISEIFANSPIEIIKNETHFWHLNQPTYLQSIYEIIPFQPYLLFANNDFQISIKGYIPNSEFINLSQGWNFIASPDINNISFDNFSFDSNIEIIKDFQHFWVPGNINNTLNSFQPGKAYYILLRD